MQFKVIFFSHKCVTKMLIYITSLIVVGGTFLIQFMQVMSLHCDIIQSCQ